VSLQFNCRKSRVSRLAATKLAKCYSGVVQLLKKLLR